MRGIGRARKAHGQERDDRSFRQHPFRDDTGAAMRKATTRENVQLHNAATATQGGRRPRPRPRRLRWCNALRYVLPPNSASGCRCRCCCYGCSGGGSKPATPMRPERRYGRGPPEGSRRKGPGGHTLLRGRCTAWRRRGAPRGPLLPRAPCVSSVRVRRRRRPRRIDAAGAIAAEPRRRRGPLLGQRQRPG